MSLANIGTRINVLIYLGKLRCPPSQAGIMSGRHFAFCQAISENDSTCNRLLGFVQLPRVLRRVNIICGGRAEAGDLHHNGIASRLRKMISAGWFGVKTSRGKRLKFRLVELVPVSNAPRARDNRCYPVILMAVRGDLRMCRHAQHDRVHACLVRVTLKHDSFNSAYA